MWADLYHKWHGMRSFSSDEGVETVKSGLSHAVSCNMVRIVKFC